MRGSGLRAAGFGLASVVVACSSSSRGSGARADAGDAGLTCMPGIFALGGSLSQTPHGVYELSDVSLSANGFSASLPAGGSVLLTWTGDATSGPVSVDGTLVLPVEGATQSWCVSSGSTVRVSGNAGTLQLRIATGVDVFDEPNGSCVQVDDADMQVPVVTVPAAACFALAS